MKWIRTFIKAILPSVVLNSIAYVRNGGNVTLFEKIANAGDKPAEAVDGYFTKFDSPETRLMFEKVVSAILENAPPPRTVLDVGCGTGRYLKALRDTFKDAQLFGVDASKATIMNYTQKLDGIRSAQWDLKGGNPFEGVVFDLVISITVLQYVTCYRIGRFIRTICGLMKPGGVFFLHFPQSDYHGIFRLISNFNYTRYPPRYVMRVLEKSGFQIIKDGYIDPSTADTKRIFGYFICAKRAE